MADFDESKSAVDASPADLGALAALAPPVDDNEILYRRVLCGGDGYYLNENHRTVVSSQAFSDRGQKPSVNRALLCEDGIAFTQEGDESNGVLSLVAKDVRAIDSVVQFDTAGRKEKLRHRIDVYPDPIKDQPGQRDNLSHAEIRPDPSYASKSIFRKLIERLAQLAAWAVKPADIR